MRKKVWGAIAVAVAAVAVFASSQQSLALWSDSASASGGTATAASVNLTVGTSAGTSAAYTLANLTTATTPVVPGNTVQAPLTVKNSGSDPLQWRMQSTSALPGFTLTTYGVANEGACPAGVNTAAPAVTPVTSGSMNASLQYPVSPAYMPTPLAAGGTYILCLRLTVGVGAVSGQTTNATFTFQAGAA
ncbi:hypothetical protein M2405_006230 [Rhodococcus erythropolis]|uniref:hypothetical protein n=1 Tax=Rhodococcus TaxID=1827 RepID=UPI000DBF4FF0|nr:MULTISPECIES: hypothetical protein [Rhodococcus]MCS4257903.1 hypothetical protein [Rhodococcus erythropolis]MCW2429145.1 hypothetical protein [Rhodococcus erythropolis]MCZ4570152.1 hypothetical protein [Rhodococcus erythropolis]MQP30663.1 hypothetical protein [Rhodococcus erythropolis]RAL36418.1 hypothetical protein CVN56_04530 [Rhodococcus sp. AQ5-07]